jgi:hypothetical protein
VLSISETMDRRVLAIRDHVWDVGRVPSTRNAYSSAKSHFDAVMQAKGWESDLSQVSLLQGQQQVLYYCAYEKSEHGLKARSIRGKLSGIRWWHVRRLKGNPLEAMDGVYAWLKDLEGMDGPPQPKLPVPITIIQLLVIVVLFLDSLDHAVKRAALVTGFWFLLRSAEYLRPDGEVFDISRGLTWEDLVCRLILGSSRKLISFEQALVSLNRGLTVEIEATLFSFKNKMETCTRSVSVVHDSDICAVKGILRLYEKICTHKGREPLPHEPVFLLEDDQVLSRDDVSQLLKAAAAKSGIPEARVASHSLRRGGCSAYIAAGGKDIEQAVMRFGRWTSTAYYAYVFPHAETLSKALKKASHLVPRFQRN